MLDKVRLPRGHPGVQCSSTQDHVRHGLVLEYRARFRPDVYGSSVHEHMNAVATR